VLHCGVHIVVDGILIVEGQVLLTHRSPQRQFRPGTWALPGGHVEAGELESGALRRELREELGIDVLDLGGAPVHRLHLTGGGPGAELRLSTWLVKTWTGQPTNRQPEEHDRLAWFSAGELDGLLWAHPEHQAVLEDLLRRPPH